MDQGDIGTKVIYVLGSSRGGTSIVGRFLGLLEGTTFAGELRRLWGPARRPGRNCGCGQPHSECEIWSKVLVQEASYWGRNPGDIERLQDAVAPTSRMWWHAWRILRRASPPSLADAQGRYVAILCDLYSAFARASGSGVIVDTSKNPADAALLARSPSVSTYCVHVIRDPRGVLFSRRKRTVPDPTQPRPWGALRTTIYWNLTHLACEAIRRRYGPERSLVVRYEEFADAPSLILLAASRLVGVPPPPSRLPYGVPIQVGAAHGPDGNGRFGATQVVLKRDDLWQEQLHPIDRFIVALLAYPLLRRYGYSFRSRRPADVPVPLSGSAG